MEIKRIHPEDVLEAYLQTGLKPTAFYYTTVVNGTKCACGLSAYAVHTDALTFEEILGEEDPNGDAFSLIVDRLGLDPDYAAGFIRGFDDLDFIPSIGLSELGYDDGRDAYELARQIRQEEV